MTTIRFMLMIGGVLTGVCFVLWIIYNAYRKYNSNGMYRKKSKGKMPLKQLKRNIRDKL